jgi:hypothetical protein
MKNDRRIIISKYEKLIITLIIAIIGFVVCYLYLF